MEDGADDEIANNNTFESRDEAKFEGYAFTGSKDRRQGQVDDGGDNIVEDLEDGEEDLDMESSLEEAKSVRNAYEQENGDSGAFDMVEAPMDSDSSDSSVSDNHNEPIADDRAALRKMMAEEQRTVAASLNKAAKADITKGRAIRDQRTTFDTLLNTRIKLQKALIATNSMSASATAPSDHSSTIQAAETAALNLWNTISTLRSSLQTPNPKKSSSSATQSNPSSDLWAEMESNEKISVPNRRANLTKWSQKTNPTLALPRANNFSQTPGQQPLTSMLDQHLSGINGEKLVAKTRIPRSCAPIQASSRTIASDVSIYDDADFYTLLLRGLVDQRMAVSNSTNMTAGLPALPNRRELKVKKPVDTKASKGRKMRYTMHEKLQNFMAPDDRGTWGERQRDELFGGLLGRKVKLGEDEEGVDGEDGDGEGSEMDGEVEVEGLRLFG